ncbi:sigma-70 family RNA polymerase sigma factor [Alkalihalobacillus sp. AL-G]|uniref:sigma-70 family RNA polymerase sigma factor n=1 Tax=Alkalihalobacillus sp. AL-G TaxID=2926399 RepID=UPI00272BC761|nr:sigma-70 family RNA polymerase sigma factor [Alkalihalobacillus sp. AL-G]WLD93600.1 sigma-70 family RNA polymerase sigma factor [Alkalihalobacillus sp. AL-G]
MEGQSHDDRIQSFSKEPSKALEKMMDCYGSTILRTAFFYLGDRHLAEDVSQEVFIRAYRNWEKFRGDSSVKTWLIRITINLCRDKMSLKASSEKPTDPFLIDGSSQFSVEEEVLKRINNTDMLKHVLNLPLHYREVLYLFYYLDLSTAEITKAIETPDGTVRGRLHRARKRLEECLKKEGLDQ